MPRPFLRYPDRRLATPAEPVEAVTDEIRALWDEMLEAMYAMPGIGLAAPQLGVPLRVIVVDASGPPGPIRLANPEIVEMSEETVTVEEGSPNIPGLTAKITRPGHIVIEGLGPDGPEKHRMGGLWAVSAQHQVDHLNGLLFIDRLGPVKRRLVLEKHRKTQRKARS